MPVSCEVLVREKGLLTTIATLRNVVRKPGRYNTRDSGHTVYRHHGDEISILSLELCPGLPVVAPLHDVGRHPRDKEAWLSWQGLAPGQSKFLTEN